MEAEPTDVVGRAQGPDDIMFLDGEDQGTHANPEGFCRGSRGYAARLPARGDPRRPFAGILFDMVGDRDLEIHPEQNGAVRAANLSNLVIDAARATGGSHFHPDPKFNVFDDHVPLLDAGLPMARVKRAVTELVRAGHDLAELSLVSDGESVWACRDDGEILDALRHGQLALFVAVDRFADEVDAEVRAFDSDRRAFVETLSERAAHPARGRPDPPPS